MVCSYSILTWESRPLIFKTWCTKSFLARFCSSPSASLTWCPLRIYHASFSRVQVPKTAEGSALHKATGALSLIQSSSCYRITLLRNTSPTEGKKTTNKQPTQQQQKNQTCSLDFLVLVCMPRSQSLTRTLTRWTNEEHDNSSQMTGPHIWGKKIPPNTLCGRTLKCNSNDLCRLCNITGFRLLGKNDLCFQS